MKEEQEGIIKGFLAQMTSQDNRATAFPYFYVIRTANWIVSCDGYANSGDDGNGVREVYVNKDDGEDELTPAEWEKIPEDGVSETGCEKDMYDCLTLQRVWEEKCLFLTEVDAERHLRLNAYHYSKDAHTYVKHAWRAPDLEEFVTALFKYFEIKEQPR